MKLVLISAGHSHTDPGALSNGVRESDLALELRDIVIHHVLMQASSNLKVLSDGDFGGNWPLRDSIALLKNSKPDLAIEFHFNSGTGSSTGVETIALDHQGKVNLAQSLSQIVSGVLGIKLRGVNGFITQQQSHRGKLGFVEAGGFIIEVCFISNLNELKTYQKNKYLLAQALADFIIDAYDK